MGRQTGTKVWGPSLHAPPPMCLLARGGQSIVKLALATPQLVLFSGFCSLGQVLGAGGFRW